MENIISAFKDSLSRRPTFLLLTGGLGPTDDDLTIEALSRVTRIPTHVDSKSLGWLAEKEKVSVGNLDKRLIKMAVSLVGVECLRNPVGWAPITHLKFAGVEIFALPGPPAEMKESFTQHISRIVNERTKRKSCSARYVATMYEEELSVLINQVMAKDKDVYIKAMVSEYKHDLGLPFQILVFGKTDGECQQKMNETVSELTRLVSSQGRVMRPL
jgi:molybdopterin-biosynthesis enzyme MoeA-like protein